MNAKQAEKQAKQAEKQAKAEAEKQAKQEKQAKAEAEKQAKQEKRAKAEAEKQAKAEAEKQAKQAKAEAEKQDPAIMRINERINKEICYNTISELTDDKLLPVYKKSESVIEELKKQEKILDECFDDSEKKQKFLSHPKNILQLIPAGTKGVIRGNKFNEIVKLAILEKNTDSDRFEICFEKSCKVNGNETSEKPDWYILEKSTGKIIIGMNQLDLWSGGAQTNRGSKYIEGNKHNNDKSKLLCVVCNEIRLSSKNNKPYKLFETGFKNDTLCYLNNLQNIILSYFN
jgi:hypothetical protein